MRLVWFVWVLCVLVHVCVCVCVRVCVCVWWVFYYTLYVNHGPACALCVCALCVCLWVVCFVCVVFVCLFGPVFVSCDCVALCVPVLVGLCPCVFVLVYGVCMCGRVYSCLCVCPFVVCCMHLRSPRTQTQQLQAAVDTLYSLQSNASVLKSWTEKRRFVGLLVC